MAVLHNDHKGLGEKEPNFTDVTTQIGDNFSHGEDDHQTQDWSPAEERKIVWKIDLRVFPMLCIVFGLSLLDRSNISAAYIAGMAEDLVLTGARYNVALLVFFIGYGLFELPSNLVIRRIGARWWLSFLIVAWGACVLGMGFVKSWSILAILRALLGVFEAGLLPGAIFIIATWYRQFETARRIAIFYMAALLASGFGPIFAYALSLIDIGDGLYQQGWRWILIIEGVVTIVAGLIAPWLLIDFPERAHFLNDHQKHIAIQRVHLEKSGVQVEHPTARETFGMLLDWKLAPHAIMYFICASSVYSIAFFAPIILREGLGFSYAKAQLLSSPPYVFTIFASIAGAYVSDKIRMRWPILIFQAIVAIVGLIVVLYGVAPGVRYFGLFLATYGTQGNIPATLTFGQNQTPRTAKKGVVAAAMISAGALGGVCGSTIFRRQDAPLYLPGMWATIGTQFLYMFIAAGLSFHFKRQNCKAEDEGTQLEEVDGFRYAP